MDQAAENKKPVLSVEGLSVVYRSAGSQIHALRDFDLKIYPGQTYGLVGESGSGKSTLAMAIMRYLSREGEITQGRIVFGDQDLVHMDKDAVRKYWSEDVALVPQNSFSSLNPAMTIGAQISETLAIEGGANGITIQDRSVEILKKVRIPDPELVIKRYPHQLSGGQRQRVLLAMALSAEPHLLVLDEPTTNLDVTTEAAVLDLVRELISEGNTAALYVTHNLGVIADITDRVAVLYASELVEDAPSSELFENPIHPYTQGLLDSIPKLGQRYETERLTGIEGNIPLINKVPVGCGFAPRCPLAVEICSQERPALESPSPGRKVRCHRWEEIVSGEIGTPKAALKNDSQSISVGKVVMEIEDLKVNYYLRRSFIEAVTGRAPKTIKAVQGVSLTLRQRQTLGIVGESGSGKSSLARAVIGLVKHSEGQVRLFGVQLPAGIKQRSKDVLKQIQMVFQNMDEAFNPYLTVGESLRRPLMVMHDLSTLEANIRAREMILAVGLPEQFLDRFPGQLSGGEKQRAAIGRAFAPYPKLLLADEPVSSLDVSLQATVLNLLNKMQAEHDTTNIFISHDIAVVAYLADEIAVMYLGQLMEVIPIKLLFDPPYHPYTEALLSAIPTINREVVQERIRLDGELPSAVDVPSGCPFHTRCPRYIGDICKTETPPWQETKSGAKIFCHIPLDELQADQKPVIVFKDETGR